MKTKNNMRGKRTWCEDTSPTIKYLRSSKKHGKTVEINGNQYEFIGDDMLYDLKKSIVVLVGDLK